MTEVTIDGDSGFCFGVVNAIRSAERALEAADGLYCLGDLVHNNLEMERLKGLGLKTVGHDDLPHLRNCTLLLRAHGEPPSTYRAAERNGIRIVDATCPVVLRLQRRISRCYQEIKGTRAQLAIYGKRGHAEVNGLVGQTEDTAVVIEKTEDLNVLEFSRDIIFFSQTTKPLDGFRTMVEAITRRVQPGVTFRYYDTICRQAANRLPGIRAFAARHDRIYFVAGEQSSNGRILFEECRKANRDVIFITGASGIAAPLPHGIRSVGVCGATSTPKWLMEEVAERIRALVRGATLTSPE
ncbi:MAG: 4-hydroxy-3-methylbut-2-enyl diphosphate reductase [Tannerella sp.]|jgi:4-hydroxy-3-methylbut-2-enyl diphosphate reductase|nr:4-hydroxy-3-methylbut-2-enyl diphosphate reductase [Tannerella sp.]